MLKPSQPIADKMSNNQMPPPGKDLFGTPGVYVEDVNMPMDLFTVDFSTTSNMQGEVPPPCAGFQREPPKFAPPAAANNSQTAQHRVTQNCSHMNTTMPVKQVKSEVTNPCQYPVSYGIPTLETPIKLEIGLPVPNNNDPCASLMTLFSPGQVDSIFNKLALSQTDFKCLRCAVKSNYEEAGSDLFGLKLAMCTNPSGGFCCPICNTKFRLPTPLEHHLNMHCLTGDGVTVRCVVCGEEHHVLIPGKKVETISNQMFTVGTVSSKKKTASKHNGGIQEQATTTVTNHNVEELQKWTSSNKNSRSKKGSKTVSDTSLTPLSYSKDCQVCGKHFGRHESLVVHMRTHTGERPYVCQTCGKAFATSSHCRSHQAVHNASLRPQCKVCGKILSRREALKRHMRIHSGEKPFSCVQCDRKFRSHSDLRAHQVVHHGASAEKEMLCPVCGKHFNRRDSLTVHLRSHTGERPYGCETCGKRFVTKSHLKSHMLTHSDVRDISCPICHKMFSRKETMRKHLRRHNSVDPFLCDHCGKGFSEKSELREHMVSHGDTRWIHVCQVCGNAYARRDSLEAHMRMHANKKPHRCGYCLKGFRKTQELRKHVRSSHMQIVGGRRYPCPICSKLFATKANVKAHKKVHSDSRCYRCSLCGKDFVHRAHLVSHMNNHRGYKPYQCRTCGKVFAFSCNLRKHMCKHTGKQPYCCRFCGKTFCHKLLEHMRVHTDDKPYSCSACGKSFRKRESRDFHMFRHTGIKPYICEICMESFGNSRQVRRHTLTHKVKNNHLLVKSKTTKSKAKHHKTTLKIPKLPGSTVATGAKQPKRTEFSVEATSVMAAGGNIVPSAQMMTFLHTQLQTALSNTMSTQDKNASANDSIPSLDPNKEATEPVAVHKDHLLLTLTIVNNFIKSHLEDIIKTMREQNTPSVLLGLMRQGDKFISRTASQCLLSWLKECQQQDEWIPILVDIITSLVNGSTSQQGLLSGFGVLKNVFTEPKPNGPYAGGLVIEKRRLICSHLVPQCSALIHRYIQYTSTDHSGLLMYNFLSLWNKLLKFHLKMPHLEHEHEILYINHLLVESLCKGDLPPMCIAKALASLNCCLPHSADISVAREIPKFHLELASRVMSSIERILDMLPLVIGDEVFGCKLYRKQELQQHPDMTIQPSACALRKVIILMLRSVAVLVHSEFKAPGPGLVTVLSTLLSMVNRLQSLAQSNTGRPGISLSWLFDTCGDQDDTMIEALLSLLHTILLLQKSCVVQLEVTQQLCSRFEPHLLFFVYIATHATWDDSMLFDLVTSPETCILAYLVKYLHYVLQDWNRFTAACQHFSNEYPLLLLSDTQAGNTDGGSTTSVASSCLEKTMTFLIRLRIKIERARSRGLIGYNCEPLLKLFRQCELLYER